MPRQIYLKFSVAFLDYGIGKKITLPCGIALRENNMILVESVFHGAKDAKGNTLSA